MSIILDLKFKENSNKKELLIARTISPKHSDVRKVVLKLFCDFYHPYPRIPIQFSKYNST